MGINIEKFKNIKFEKRNSCMICGKKMTDPVIELPDFPMTEIARESNVSYNSLKVFFPKLVETGILIKTRRIGKSDYYKFNMENTFVKNLINTTVLRQINSL